MIAYLLSFIIYFVILGESLEELNGYGTYRPRNIISTILGGTPSKAKHLWISNPQDFRQVFIERFLNNLI